MARDAATRRRAAACARVDERPDVSRIADRRPVASITNRASAGITASAHFTWRRQVFATESSPITSELHLQSTPPGEAFSASVASENLSVERSHPSPCGSNAKSRYATISRPQDARTPRHGRASSAFRVSTDSSPSSVRTGRASGASLSRAWISRGSGGLAHDDRPAKVGQDARRHRARRSASHDRDVEGLDFHDRSDVSAAVADTRRLEGAVRHIGRPRLCLGHAESRRRVSLAALAELLDGGGQREGRVICQTIRAGGHLDVDASRESVGFVEAREAR